jgi:hypothetical protein
LQQGIILLALTEKLRAFRSPPQSSDVLTCMAISYEKALVISIVPAQQIPGKGDVPAIVDRQNPPNPAKTGGAVVANVSGFAVRSSRSSKHSGRLEFC